MNALRKQQTSPLAVLAINEDEHFRFADPDNHMLAAPGEYASRGYFDFGRSDYAEGNQCPPVNWGIDTERKRQFFTDLKMVTGI